MIVTKYVSVQVKISITDKAIKAEMAECDIDRDDAIQELAERAINEADYMFKYNEDGIKIVDTDILDMQDHAPIGM